MNNTTWPALDFPDVHSAPADSMLAGADPVERPASCEVPSAPPPTAPWSPPLAPVFAPLPGETPRAFNAFIAYFDLGHRRSLPAVADQLGESLSTVKGWSSRHRWAARIQAFDAGRLHLHAQARLAAEREHAADWACRSREAREQNWDAAQKLRRAAQCFLENFGDREMGKMTLAQVSRALEISARLARHALAGDRDSETPSLVPLQQELEAALEKAYGQTQTPDSKRGAINSSPAS